jgi:outer membrane protein assembly factor BamB
MRDRVLSVTAVSVLLSLAQAVSAVSASAAELTLSPAVGPPTTAVSANGAGFPASDPLTVTFDSATVASATTGSTGKFSAKFNVPASALPGTHRVSAFDPAGLGASAGFLVQTEWGSYRFDQSGSGFNPYENVLSTATVEHLSPLSSPSWEGHVLSAPIYTQGMVVAGSDDGTVRAFDPASGNQLWSFAAGGQVLGSPLAVKPNAKNPGPKGDCAIVTGSTNGMVYGLDPKTGAQLWSYRSPGPNATSPIDPTAVEAVVLVAIQEDSGVVFSLNGCTGSPVWSQGGPGPITSAQSPAELSKVKLADGTTHTIIVVCFGGSVHAYDALGGQELWSAFPPNPCSGPPSAYGMGTGARIVLPAGSALIELSASTGALVWSKDTGAAVPGAAALDSSETLVRGRLKLTPHAVIAGNEAGEVLALDPKTGKALWATKAPGPPGRSAPAVANGVVYVLRNPGPSGDEGTLQALDANTGSPLFSLNLGLKNPGPGAFPSPSVADGRVYVGGFDGGLRVLGLSAGAG